VGESTIARITDMARKTSGGATAKHFKQMDSETELEMLLDLTSLKTFVEAEPCGTDCLALKFKREEMIVRHEVRGLHPAIVEKFSQLPFF
jgi:hypothetical protein